MGRVSSSRGGAILKELGLAISVFELYTIGIGTSSSHSVGPMRAAYRFVQGLQERALLPEVNRIEVALYGSLALTGVGHGTDKAIVMGLLGEQPESVAPDLVVPRFEAVCETGQLDLLGNQRIGFSYDRDIKFLRKVVLPEHPNGLQLTAFGAEEQILAQEIYF